MKVKYNKYEMRSFPFPREDWGVQTLYILEVKKSCVSVPSRGFFWGLTMDREESEDLGGSNPEQIQLKHNQRPFPSPRED